MPWHLVSHPCPATAVTANGFFYGSYWVMGGYQLVHAWELPRNSSHHLITVLIKVTGRLRPVKNKCVDLQQNMYLENTIRAVQNVLESTRQIEAVWRPRWKMSVHKGTDSKAMGKDSDALETQAWIQNREKVPERADQEDRIRGSGKATTKAKAGNCQVTVSAAAGL